MNCTIVLKNILKNIFKTKGSGIHIDENLRKYTHSVFSFGLDGMLLFFLNVENVGRL